MTRKRFQQLVGEALDRIPRRFREETRNVAVVVEDRPSDDLLRELGMSPGEETLYGLYQGTPLPERDWAHGNVLPDAITIYREPILADYAGDDEIVRAIGETVIHEFGHYFGLSEEEIEAIEADYWYAEPR